MPAKPPAKNEKDRVASGIPGLDELIQGGFKPNSVTTLRGGTGTGKTMFSLQYLYNGASRYDEAGVFISFGEAQDSVYEIGDDLNWDLHAMEKKGKFAFLRYTPYDIDRILKEGGGNIKDTIDSIRASRVVIDSLTAYSILFESAYKRNQGIVQLFDILKSWQCTVLVTDEQDTTAQSTEAGNLGFLTDGLIHLYHERRESGRFRGIEVIKMRHTAHADSVYLFKMEKGGIRVYPQIGLFGKE